MAKIRVFRIILLIILISLESPIFGFTAQKRNESLEYKIIRAEQLLKKIQKKEKLYLIDCRPNNEYQAGHIPGAVNISIDSYGFGKETVIKRALEKILNETDKEIHFILLDRETGEEYMPKTKLVELLKHLPHDRNEELIFYCRRPTCIRSPIAARWTVALGYTNVFRYEGSWKDWNEKKYPIKK